MNETLSEINGINNINPYQTNNLQNYIPTSQLYPELGSPSVGPFISPLPDKESIQRSKIYTTMTCYNCLSVLLIRKDWNFTRCGECQKINRIPKEKITENFGKYSYYQEDNDLIGDIPYVYGLVNCPFCTTENKIRKEAKRVTCYNCGNSFSVNGYNNNKIEKISNSYNRRFPYTLIKYNEYIPIYPHHECNCKQNYILEKILETIKEKKKPIITYPTLFNDPFLFKYNELIHDIKSNKRYENNYNNNYNYSNNNQLMKTIDFQINNNENKKKDNDFNGFRITIRKKNKDKYNKSYNGNNLSKSAVFEKVFFTNKLNDNNENKNFFK